MNYHDAFLESIRQAPDDDALRLIYADWLADHGEPERAEFVRLEIDLAAWKGDAPPPWVASDYHRLDARWHELVERHSDRWHADLLPHVMRFDTRRGFVTRVDTTSRQFATSADALFAAAPLLVAVRFDRIGRHMAAVARRPELGRLRWLECYKTTLDTAGVRDLCRGDLDGLRSLHLDDNRFATAGAVAVANCPRLAGLEALGLSGNPINEPGGRAVVAALPALVDLDLYESRVGDRTAEAIARRDGRPWRSLQLGANGVSPVGAAALAESAQLAELVELDLFCCPIDDAGLLALAGSRHLARLRVLDVSLTNAGDAANAALLRSAAVAGVEELALGTSHDFGPAAAAALAASEARHRLRKLTLNGLDQSVTPVLGRAALPSLRSLDLRANRLPEPDLRPLLEGPLLATVERLDLAGCDLGEAGAAALAGAAVLAGVRVLNLGGNRIGPTGARALAGSPHLAGLYELRLAENPLEAAGASALRDRFGDKVQF